MEKSRITLNISKKLRKAPWGSILSTMRQRLKKTGKLLMERRKEKDLRIEKKVGLMRMALLHRLERKAKERVDTSFLLDMIELIQRLEELVENYQSDLEIWVEFLEIIEKKLEEEGLLVEDEEALKQAKRLKKAVERLRTRLEASSKTG